MCKYCLIEKQTLLQLPLLLKLIVSATSAISGCEINVITSKHYLQCERPDKQSGYFLFLFLISSLVFFSRPKEI